MTLSVGFRITVSLLILLPKLRGADSYPGGTDSHRTRQPSLDAQRLLSGVHSKTRDGRSWPTVASRLIATGIFPHHAMRSIRAGGGCQRSCSELGMEASRDWPGSSGCTVKYRVT